MKIDIITSLDHPFAMSDRVRGSLKKTQKCLSISAPWTSMNFIDMLRVEIPHGAEIKFLIRTPRAKEEEHVRRANRCVESLRQTAREKDWNLEVKCSPNNHAKLMIIDENTVLHGSLNPTFNGMYHNHEVCTIFEICNHTEKSIIQPFIDYFQKLWSHEHSIRWQIVKTFHGFKDNNEAYRRIAEHTVGYLTRLNRPTEKWKAVNDISKLGYSKLNVEKTIRSLIQDGIIFSPKYDTIKLVEDTE